VALREEVDAALARGERRLGAWAGAERAAVVVFPTAGEPFFNVNTPADLARARQLVADPGSGI
jgi:molybdopterin-guanine dinucleotide biosynthesis protein A